MTCILYCKLMKTWQSIRADPSVFFSLMSIVLRENALSPSIASALNVLSSLERNGRNSYWILGTLTRVKNYLYIMSTYAMIDVIPFNY